MITEINGNKSNLFEVTDKVLKSKWTLAGK